MGHWIMIRELTYWALFPQYLPWVSLKDVPYSVARVDSLKHSVLPHSCSMSWERSDKETAVDSLLVDDHSELGNHFFTAVWKTLLKRSWSEEDLAVQCTSNTLRHTSWANVFIYLRHYKTLQSTGTVPGGLGSSPIFKLHIPGILCRPLRLWSPDLRYVNVTMVRFLMVCDEATND